MCGRYVVAYDPQTLVSGFSVVRVPAFPRRFNIAPQSPVPVVYETREGERIAELMQWGLVPHWARDNSIGAKLNNARAEGVAEKPSFRQAVRKRRCLLPASGFYEWKTLSAPVPAGGRAAKPVKQPYFISPSPASGEALFAMAGLFEAWRPRDSAADAPWLLTCCVITTAPNALMADIHDRMPVMVPRDQWAAWLDRTQQDPDVFAPLMTGVPASAMQAWPVRREVGRSSSEGPQLIEPLADLGDRPEADG
ncbi:MAG: SOS response-associated peptidase [Aquabacterium sp.]